MLNNLSPNVTILNNILHPNITLLKDCGKICISILLKNYTHSILLSSIVTSHQFLLQQPNPNDARNQEAADQEMKELDKFKAKINMFHDEMSPEADE